MQCPWAFVHQETFRVFATLFNESTGSEGRTPPRLYAPEHTRFLNSFYQEPPVLVMPVISIKFICEVTLHSSS